MQTKRRRSEDTRNKKRLKFDSYEPSYDTKVEIHPHKRSKDTKHRFKIIKVESSSNETILVTENQTRIHLSEDWFRSTTVYEGDIVNVVFTTKIEINESKEIFINNKNNLLVLHPDILLNSSQVGQSYNCIRKGIFSPMLFKTNKFALEGTIVHQLFQESLEKETSWDENFPKIAKINQKSIFECDQTDVQVLENIENNFSSQFKQLKSFKEPMMIKFQDTFKKVVIKKVLDCEESIWSFQFGLRAKIDQSMLVSIDEKDFIIPFELKTGKMDNGYAKFEHQAQVQIYILLMSERYKQQIDHGMLFYFKDSRVFGISRNQFHINALIQTRNRIVAEMKSNFSSQDSMCKKPNVCNFCFQKDFCMIHHISVENGNMESSGAPEIFKQETSHLSKTDIKFMNKWINAIHYEMNYNTNTDLTLLTSEEKEKNKGDCLSRMVIKSVDERSMKFIFEKEIKVISLKKSLFQVGDSVIVSSEMNDFGIASGLVLTISDDYIELSLDHQLRIPFAPSNLFWRIDKRDFFNNTKANVLNLFKRTNNDEKRRRLIVDLQEPKFGKDPEIESFDKNLNKEQLSAVKAALSAEDYCIILGFPGTGKTFTIAQIIKHLYMMGKKVLISSHTNSAIENILSFLDRLGIPYVNLKEKIDSKFQTSQEYENYIQRSQIFSCSCYSAPKNGILSKIKIDYCIIDEAGQITLPDVLAPLSYANIFILVGDHKQLPPVVKNKQSKEFQLDVSLFQYLGRKFQNAVRPLLHQYRMNQDILFFSNHLVYKNKLKCFNNEIKNRRLKIEGKFDPEWLNQIKNEFSVLFFSTDDLEDSFETKEFDGVVNKKETLLIKVISSALLSSGLREEDIGIISPFNSQIKNLKDQISNPNILINTIDRFQGIDRRCILVSMVKSNKERDIGELMKDIRRINVAITRAKEKLIFVGSQKTFEKNLPELMNLLAKKKCIYPLPSNALDVNWSFHPNEVEDNFSPKVASILNYYIYGGVKKDFF
jgi:DNA replication ATP-dependent helicase Dna2